MGVPNQVTEVCLGTPGFLLRRHISLKKSRKIKFSKFSSKHYKMYPNQPEDTNHIPSFNFHGIPGHTCWRHN